MARKRLMHIGLQVDIEQTMTKDGDYVVPVKYHQVVTEITGWNTNKVNVYKVVKQKMKELHRMVRHVTDKGHPGLDKELFGNYPAFMIQSKEFIEPDANS